MAVEEKREYAMGLLDDVPDNKWDNVIGFLEGITALPKEEDPFYSEENQTYLKEIIKEIDEGRVVLKVHDIVEV